MCSAASRGAGPSDASPGNLNWQWPRRHSLRALVGHVRRASGACGGGLQGAPQRAWASCLTLGFLGTRGTLCMQGSSLSLGFFSGEVLRITAVSRDGVVQRASCSLVTVAVHSPCQGRLLRASCARARPESRCRCHPEFRLCTAWSGNPTSCCYRTWDCLGLPPSCQFSW